VNVMIDYLDRIQERLSTVVIENKDFENLLKVYDRLGTFFYLDPPYYGTEKYYQVQFKTEDHVRLKETLDNVNGKFLLSYNDCDYIRDLYKNYNIEAISRNHNLRTKYKVKDKEYKELIITNY
ncbi:MAG: DNA adenine methylase, partial [Vallitalea sp.]|nr:DNA adenine methylase [Vallitalea sp.]